ncbi:hypothetical protein [Amycolatopsis thailandensis]|uniref:Uncharacterized protein n=1 Tax=Amycolatopsis thailandensis TaxID=589330 RepID=A0A229SEJ6_9PSEU|nr:hypothetical protein [Amycolatopsis thailandensis]OXM57326.1 hypothetical protein CFP71_08625 [Amycolatopsis thailandensis]
MATDRNGDGRIDIFIEATRGELRQLRGFGEKFATDWQPIHDAINVLTGQLGRGKMGESFQVCKDNTPGLLTSAGTVPANYAALATNGETGVKVYEGAQTEATRQFGA